LDFANQMQGDSNEGILSCPVRQNNNPHLVS